MAKVDGTGLDAPEKGPRTGSRPAESRKRMVSIRMDADDIEGIKAKAARMGVNYQTLINSLVHRYLNGAVSFQETF